MSSKTETFCTFSRNLIEVKLSIYEYLITISCQMMTFTNRFLTQTKQTCIFCFGQMNSFIITVICNSKYISFTVSMKRFITLTQIVPHVPDLKANLSPHVLIPEKHRKKPSFRLYPAHSISYRLSALLQACLGRADEPAD